jgi:hypothetical protein
MKIVHTFGVTNDPDEGLWALELEGKVVNEYQAIFEIWRDPEIMYEFCVENQEDLHRKFGYPIRPPDAADIMMDEADELEEMLMNLAKKKFPGTNLQQLFKPLDNNATALTELQLSKGSIKNKRIRDPKLRIYAIRIAKNAYVFTGGAIKLTNRMEERPHTQEQLVRMINVRTWLKSQGICYPEDLNALS